MTFLFAIYVRWQAFHTRTGHKSLLRRFSVYIEFCFILPLLLLCRHVPSLSFSSLAERIVCALYHEDKDNQARSLRVMSPYQKLCSLVWLFFVCTQDRRELQRAKTCFSIVLGCWVDNRIGSDSPPP